jgi:PAS domain S-box-containing protein
MSNELNAEQLSSELIELRQQLEEANDTIHAIRTGMVDAFVVQGSKGHQLYTLESSDHTFRILVEKMQEGAITLNKNGVILYCNPCFSDMTKYPLDKIIGKQFDHFIKGYSPERLNKMTSDGTLNDYKMEDILLRSDEVQLPVMLSLTNLALEDGTALSIICTDLTDQKAAQQTEADIDSQRKIIAQKDEFIGIASHELKTPLTSLKAYLQLMSHYKGGDLPAPIINLVSKAELSLNRLQTLINDLLDVSKIQAGKLDFSRTDVNINDLVAICTENANHMFPDYTINCHCKGEFWVIGNSERLEQVLMNLINNAVKYSPINKEIKVNVNLENEQIKVSVTDRGIGMSLDQQEKIFDRFYRVDDKNHMVGGLGMGLYISREIVKDHDGLLGVDSIEGEGSTFFMLLPPIRKKQQRKGASNK